MSEMIERVAKAIAGVIDSAMPNVYVHTLDYKAAARAAIQAMREPTEQMVDAVYRQEDPGFCDEPGTPTAPDDVWRQMIDEALERVDV